MRKSSILDNKFTKKFGKFHETHVQYNNESTPVNNHLSIQEVGGVLEVFDIFIIQYRCDIEEYAYGIHRDALIRGILGV